MSKYEAEKELFKRGDIVHVGANRRSLADRERGGYVGMIVDVCREPVVHGGSFVVYEVERVDGVDGDVKDVAPINSRLVEPSRAENKAFVLQYRLALLQRNILK